MSKRMTPWEKLRRYLHLTPAQMGDSVGLSRQRIVQLESGEGPDVRLEVLRRLFRVHGRALRACGITEGDFVWGAEGRPRAA